MIAAQNTVSMLAIKMIIKIMIPRHKKLSPGLSAKIGKELVELHGFTEEDVLNLF